jgi:hypothetical protein
MLALVLLNLRSACGAGRLRRQLNTAFRSIIPTLSAAMPGVTMSGRIFTPAPCPMRRAAALRRRPAVGNDSRQPSRDASILLAYLNYPGGSRLIEHTQNRNVGRQA